ncbi:hypothetical protein JCM8547_007169 [Rhodosporidiobolus lusitaniae]
MHQSATTDNGSTLETLSKTALASFTNTITTPPSLPLPVPDDHPVPLPEPPAPPGPSAHAELPSVAALSLSSDGPVEPQLPVNPVALDEAAALEDAQRSPMTANLAYSYPPPPATGDDTAGAIPYPEATPHLTRAPVAVLTKDPAVGRGVFATDSIQAGEVVEISPVLVLSEEEYKGRKKGEEDDGTLKGVEASQLRGYVFSWGRNGSMAVALGLGSLFNHSANPNVSYSLDTSAYTISYRAAKPIAAGEELCIFYGHNVTFAGDNTSSAAQSDVSEDDGWGGLGGVASQGDSGESSDEELAGLKRLTVAELAERDNEIMETNVEGFPWRKISEIIDPEDEVLSTMPCYAITVAARHSASVFSFCRKHTNRKFNELGHLKRVKPIEQEALEGVERRLKSKRSSASDSGESSGASSDSEDGGNASDRSAGRMPSIRTGPDAQQRVLLFPVTTAPANLQELLAASPLAQQLREGEELPVPYVVEVPAKPAHTEEQAEEWGKVWPVQVVHIREGAKATRRKRGWERAKMEWITKEAKKVWTKAEEAAQRGEHPIACHVTDSWTSGFHTSLRRPLTLVNSFDTRKTTGNVLAHAACNAIDAIGVLDLHGGRPPRHLFGPGAADPPYLLTGLTVFMSHEPCLLCAMSLLHSRIKNLFYIKRAPGAGGCGSLYNVHEDGGLNHRFEVWEWVAPLEEGGIGVGAGDGLRCDP